MPKVGDRVQVKIEGPAALPGTATLEEGHITVSGTVVEEKDNEWIVRLDVSFEGRNLVRVRKSVFVGSGL